ncbi:MAG TPA: replication-relaxation family protein, partial [Ktedonobacterales bacterium]|nr:replication-relaxation family protein [Ktedonobacterales bacterium]
SGTHATVQSERPADDLLRWLLRFPLLRVADVAQMAGLSPSRAYARLADLRRHSLVTHYHVPFIADCASGGSVASAGSSVYAITSLGIELLATQYGASVSEVARRWGADDAGIARLLPRAPAVVRTQAFVLPLITGAAAALHGVLAHERQGAKHPILAIEWAWIRDYPLHFVRGSRIGQLRLDAYVRLHVAQIAPIPATSLPSQVQRSSTCASPRVGADGTPESHEATMASAPGSHRWYGCFVLLDDGVADEHLMLRQMRLLLRCRETLADETPKVAFPSLLILTGSAHRAARWQALTLRLASDFWLTHPLLGGVVVVPTSAPSGVSQWSPWVASWRSLALARSCRLTELLAPAAQREGFPPLDAAPHGVKQSGTREQTTTLTSSRMQAASPPRKQTVALAQVVQALDPRHLHVLRLLYAHPFLSVPDLAALLCAETPTISRYLRPLRALQLVGAFHMDHRDHADADVLPHTAARSRRAAVPAAVGKLKPAGGGSGQRVDQYTLTPHGIHLLGACLGLFGRTPTIGRTQALVTRYEREVATLARTSTHTAGVYAFFAALTVAARVRTEHGEAHHLLWWDTGNACARQYRDMEGWHAIRPDGAGEYQAGARRMRFWLEWDRGTMGRRDLEAKFAAYAHYVRSREWRLDGTNPLPLLLIVTNAVAQETRILAALKATNSSRVELSLFLTSHAALQERGPLATIWRPWRSDAQSCGHPQQIFATPVLHPTSVAPQTTYRGRSSQ